MTRSLECTWITGIGHSAKLTILLFTRLCGTCISKSVQSIPKICVTIGIFESPKCDVNPQPITRGIGPLVGRTSCYRRSVMHVLWVLLGLTCHFFFICQNIFVRVIWSGREFCPLLMNPSIFLVF